MLHESKTQTHFQANEIKLSYRIHTSFTNGELIKNGLTKRQKLGGVRFSHFHCMKPA